MIQLYLVTGFLGAGKTTFLKKFIKEMSDKRLHIIVNEFGKEGIDGKLLAELGIAIDEINNGSIFCSCRLDKFEEILGQAVRLAPELILVEASGLSDPTNIRKILANEEKFHEIAFMGCICLADAINFKKVYQTARVVNKQISVSDVVLISKTDIAEKETTEETINLIKNNYPNLRVLKGDFAITKEWLERLKIENDIETNQMQIKDITLQKALITIDKEMSLAQLRHFISMFIENSYRVKGFVQITDGVYLVNCVGSYVTIDPYRGDALINNKIVALAGDHMALKKSIKMAIVWYKDFKIEVE